MAARPVTPPRAKAKTCPACKGKKRDLLGRTCKPCAGTGLDTKWS